MSTHSTFTFETSLSVSDYLELSDGDAYLAFAECQEDTRQALEDGKSYIATLVDESVLSQLEFTDAKFVEFDSGNPSHAEGYFEVTIAGPSDAIEQVKQAIARDVGELEE